MMAVFSPSLIPTSSPSPLHVTSHCEKAGERGLKCLSVQGVPGTSNTQSHLLSPAPCEVLRHQFDR